MARKPRVRANSGVYHVLMQGVRRGLIFQDDEDYKYFIGILERLMFDDPDDKEESKVEVEDKKVRNFTLYAYCLMPSYFQLLIKEEHNNISTIVKRIATSYSAYFNGKYDRDGAIYRGRFTSEPVETMERFDIVLRYIHQTPLRDEKVSNLNEPAYSSWYEYVGKGMELPKICEIKEAYQILGADTLQIHLSKPIDKGISCLKPVKATRRFSDEQVSTMMKEMVGTSDKTTFQNLSYGRQRTAIIELREQGASIRQLERLTGIGRGIVWKMK